MIIHKPGAYNKADALSRQTDLNEGIENNENEDRVLLDKKFFTVRALQPVMLGKDAHPFKKRIRNTQSYDSEVSQAMETLLCNGPHSVIKGLED